MDCMNLVTVISRYTRAVRSGAAGAARAAPLFVAKLVIYSKSNLRCHASLVPCDD